MKKLLLLVLLSGWFTICLCQTDTTVNNIDPSEVNSIWKADSIHFPLKRGFYKSYQEFLTNSPSEQRAFTVKEKTKSKERKESGILAVDYELDDGQEKVGKIWGFCDGNTVYIKASPLESKYWKVAYVGPCLFFIHVYQVRTLGGIVAAGTVGTREMFIVNSHGKPLYASEKHVKKILEKCPGLAEEYEASSNAKAEEIKMTFLRKANEYFALHPEVVE